MKRVVVTGGAGYIGCCLSSHLLSANLEVCIVDKLLFGGEGLLGLANHPHCRVVVGDVRDPSVVKEAMHGGVDAVVHLAALVGDKACDVDPVATEKINVDATRMILRNAADSGATRFVFFSTCSNYGVSEPNVLADETTPLRPLSSYATTKIKAEQIVLEESDPKLCSFVLRLGTICGLSPRMRFNLLINEMARAAALNHSISVYSPNAWRPYLHVRDACRAVQHCLSISREAGQPRVFNIVGENKQKNHLIELVRKHYPNTRIEITPAATDLRDYRVSAKRAEDELGFRSSETIEQAFAEIATAVEQSYFVDPARSIYEAEPAPQLLKCA